jgi:hypothetical protein
MINAILVRRRAAPFARMEEVGEFSANAAPALSRLRLGGNTIFTLRSTARLRLPDGKLSDLRRTVAAQVKYWPMGYGVPYTYLRWYDHATTN